MAETKEKKPLPILYEKKSECCGCTACYSICPRYAISMQTDEEGFEYPVIDSKICIRCYSCLRVCPIKVANVEKTFKT